MMSRQEVAVWITVLVVALLFAVSIVTASTLGDMNARKINSNIVQTCIENGGTPVVNYAGSLISCNS